MHITYGISNPKMKNLKASSVTKFTIYEIEKRKKEKENHDGQESVGKEER